MITIDISPYSNRIQNNIIADMVMDNMADRSFLFRIIAVKPKIIRLTIKIIHISLRNLTE